MDENRNEKLASAREKTMERRADAVLSLLSNTPDGTVYDADTILKDLMDEADFEVSGIAEEIIGIWKKSGDRKSVEDLFQSFTDCGFGEWLRKCVSGTTRKDAAPEFGMDRLARAEQVLEDNGIEPDECSTVLQAIGYVLLDAELYPE